MSPDLKLDNREFQDTLNRVLATTPRALGEEITTRAYFIAKKAHELSPVADRAKIQADLGATIQSERIDKRGKTRRRYKYSPTPVVFAIINARLRKAGKPPMARNEMASAAKKLISSRLRAVGSLKSGWKNALRILGRAARQAANITGPVVKMFSRAKPAREGWRPTAEFEYRVSIQKGGGREIDQRVVNALNSGFQSELAQMKAKLERKIETTLRRAGAIK